MQIRTRIAAFTLLELLVVVAIIALLIGLLLPSLGKAKEAGRNLVCLSNQRQLTMAMQEYAYDYEQIPGAYWEGPDDLDWGGKNNARYLANPTHFNHPLETSVLYEYFSTIDKILECPTAQREANTFYDYTMIIRLAGARTDLEWKMSYALEPALGLNSEREWFHAIPILMEEHAEWYNTRNDDGSWANHDQVTARHEGGANISYLDGSAGRFISPTGQHDVLQEPGDLSGRHLLLHVGNKRYETWYGQRGKYGWVNKPDGPFR